MTAVAGPEGVPEQILGRRTLMEVIFSEFAQADNWGILRYVPHDRLDPENTSAAWVPEFEPDDDPDAWHPMSTLYAPLYSADGQILGNMSVDLPPGNRVPNQQQRELLEMFVVQAGLAIANAQQRERLAEQVRLGQALMHVVAAGSLGELDLVLAEVAPALHAGLDATQVTLRCFPDTADSSQDHAAGYPSAPISGDQPVDLRHDLVSFTSHSEPRPLLLDRHGGDWKVLPRTSETLRLIMEENGWERMLVAPLGVRRDVLGYLVVMRGPECPIFNPAEIEAAHEASREVGRLVRDARIRETERRLVAELQELDRYKGELIATISHELKTPLTSIIGHAELLEAGEIAVGSVNAIQRNADRLDRLINNLLSFSKMQEQRELVRVPVDLAALGRHSLETLAVQAAAGGVELISVPSEETVLVAADPEELQRVVDNLCSNAVKYTRPGGRVTVEVRQRDRSGELCVTDTGLGISEGDRAHLFSAFHRSTNPDALTIPGTGLGLAISRRIAELHGGAIAVESQLGRGSTFTLRVPLAGS